MDMKIISLPTLPLGKVDVNCYLINCGDGFVLIDAGCKINRSKLLKQLENAGCKPGHLKLVLLTHGDFDHTGNAAFLRENFGARLAMHREDSGMVEKGEIFWSRKKRGWFATWAAAVLFGFGKRDRYQPDLYLDEGDSLADYGLDAGVLHIPGHTRGSIGILTTERDLFCGDLLVNGKTPRINNLIDNEAEAQVSLEKLKNLGGIGTVYPGHGLPFSFDSFLDQSGEREEIDLPPEK